MTIEDLKRNLFTYLASALVPTLVLGALIIGCGGGSEAGSANYGTGVLQSNINPVDGLAVIGSTSTGVTLQWSAPDSSDGIDKAASYDMRYSTSPIYQQNWSISTVVDGEPVPASPGTFQQMTVTGLSPNTKYYFALKSRNPGGVEGPISNVPAGTTKPLTTSNSVHVTACMDLDQPDTTYILDNDVRSEGTCFKIKAKNVILNLNGHRVLYDDYPNTGLPNPGFEIGNGDIPSDWDLTQAPTVTRRSTAQYAMDNQWYLYFGNVSNGTRIVSPWTYLPPSREAAVYFVRGDKLWAYQTAPDWNITVEFEDGSIVMNRAFTKDQVFGFTTKPYAGRYRAALTLSNSHGFVFGQYGVYPSIDLFDLRPQKSYGIYSEYQSNIVIMNGSVIQGSAKSLSGHGVYISGAKNVTIQNLRVENSGMEASSIHTNWSSTVKIADCFVINRNPYIFDRMQLKAAVMATNGSGLLITNNEIDSGSGWGGILASSSDFDIAYNTVRTKCPITNHHGIGTAGVGASVPAKNIRIHHNIVDADPGQGIIAAPSGGEIYNNSITIRKTEPNFEYGYISNDGITVKDYGNRWCNNLRVFNNTISLFGAYDKYYTGYESGEKLVNGIMNMCTGGPVVFDNNQIVARSVDPEVRVTGLEPGGKYDNPTVFSNNVIESDMANIVFGGYAGQGDTLPNIRFISNTLIKGSNPVNYHTFGMERSGNIKTDGIRFLDTKLLGGASLLDVELPGSYGRFSYFVDWSVDVLVTDTSGAPVPSASVTFKDKNMVPVYSGTTGEDGRLSSVELSQYQRVGNGVSASSSIVYFTPYRVEIATGTGSPVIKDFILDRGKIVRYVVGGQITVADRI